MTPEGKVKAVVKKILNEVGAYHNWPVPAGYGESTLDCIGCYKGQFFAIETKAPNGKVTERQQFVREKMETAGGMVFIIGQEIYNMTDGSGVEYSGVQALKDWLFMVETYGASYTRGYSGFIIG